MGREDDVHAMKPVNNRTISKWFSLANRLEYDDARHLSDAGHETLVERMFAVVEELREIARDTVRAQTVGKQVDFSNRPCGPRKRLATKESAGT